MNQAGAIGPESTRSGGYHLSLGTEWITALVKWR